MSFESLNLEQQAAVLAEEEAVLVLAGAGSGKTRVLVERVAHLLSTGASGYEIVCTTFTRAAATEMKARLQARIGREAYKVTVSTFHGIGLGLLQKYGHHAGLRYGHLTVLTPFETDTLIQHCGEMLGLYSKGKWAHGKKQLDALFAAFERGSDEETLPTSPYNPLLKSFASICQQHNVMPYYGLIHGLTRLAESCKVADFTNWKHFLVDEVQDLDRMQWRALYAMYKNKHDGHLFAVGDISQSIYGFRGAVPQQLQSMIDNKELRVYELRSNYRSASDIVHAANRLIRHNTSHNVITMQAMLTHGNNAAVRQMNNADSAALADFIATDSWEHPPVVLCRNNRMLDKLSSELSARDVSHRRIGNRTTAVHSPLFVKANAALKCMVNPYDETAFLMAHKGLGLDAKHYAHIRVRAAEEDKTAFAIYTEEIGAEISIPMPADTGLVSSARDWFASGGYLFDPADGDKQAYLDWMQAYTLAHPEDTIADYLDWVALIDVQDEVPDKEEAPGVLLMTCHASKGLEFPCVIVAGCNEGIMPSKQSFKAEDEGIEDERRLMYVATTRAMNALILAVRPEKEGEGISRFVVEMGE